MDAITGIEHALVKSLDRTAVPGAPPRLAEALRYAVFPRGARIRPRLCLAVAGACGDDRPALAEAAAAAIELLHCASLIHDDLPCFDDAAFRRGKPSVHRAFGERIAVLAGDALIVLAFQTLGQGGADAVQRLPGLLSIVGGSVGMPTGIVAGQAWECESAVDLAQYQRQKTGALFAAAAMAGAHAAGHDGEAWGLLGERLGEAYQVADDLADAIADPEELGKPVGRDAALARPSAVQRLGIEGAALRFGELTASAVAAIPPCPQAAELRNLILSEARRLLPKHLPLQAA